MTSVTVVVPLTIRRRGGRKQSIGPDGAAVQAGGGATETRGDPALGKQIIVRDGALVEAGGGAAGVAETQGDPALVKALARAFRWRRMLEEGRYASVRELAKAEGVDRSYVGRALNLTLLAPEVVEAILDGRQAEGMTVPGQMDPFPMRWPEQRDTLQCQATTGRLMAYPHAAHVNFPRFSRAASTR